MFIRDKDSIDSIEALGRHFRTHIANRYTHAFFSSLEVSQQVYDKAYNLLIRSELMSYKNYPVAGFYEEAVATGQYIVAIRDTILPQIKERLRASRNSNKMGRDSLAEMAFVTFEDNIDLLAEGLKDTLGRIADRDAEDNKQSCPIYTRFPGLSIIRHIGGITDELPEFLIDE